MTKELINTPERLAHVKSASASSWAAINKRKQKSHAAKQSQKQISQAVSRPRLDASATAQTHAASVDTAQEEAEDSGAASQSDSKHETEDAADEAAFHPLPQDSAEGNAQVGSTQSKDSHQS